MDILWTYLLYVLFWCMNPEDREKRCPSRTGSFIFTESFERTSKY